MDHDPIPVQLRDRGPGTLNLLRFFVWEHLPPQLQAVSRPIAELAQEMAINLPDSAELTAGLRKLLEAKDCFVRAALPPAPAYPLIPKSEQLARFDGEKPTPTVSRDLLEDQGPSILAVAVDRRPLVDEAP